MHIENVQSLGAVSARRHRKRVDAKSGMIYTATMADIASIFNLVAIGNTLPRVGLGESRGPKNGAAFFINVNSSKQFNQLPWERGKFGMMAGGGDCCGCGRDGLDNLRPRVHSLLT